MEREMNTLAEITELREEGLNREYISCTRRHGDIWNLEMEQRMEYWYGRDKWPVKREDLLRQAGLRVR